MSLKGSLQTVALTEVLQFLSSTGKSGEFQVSGGRGEGRLWFEDGAIGAFDAWRSFETSDAIWEMLRIEDGEFHFSAGVTAPPDAHRGDGDVTRAIEAAEARMDQWRDIVSVVPSLDHHVDLHHDAPGDGVHLEPAQWSLVVAIAAGRSVGDVLSARELSEFEGCRSLRDLVQMGLVDISQPKADAPPPDHDEPETAYHEVEADDDVVETPAEDDHAPKYDQTDEYEHTAEYDPAVGGSYETDVDTGDAGVSVANDGVASLPGRLLRFGIDPVEDDTDIAAGDPVGVDTDPVDGPALGFGETEEEEPPADVSYGGFPVAVAPYEEVETYEETVDHEYSDQAADSAADRYAALRAAMVEVGENLVSEPADTDHDVDDQGSPVYAIEEHPEVDGRAALQALLTEVTSPSQDEPVDGLADRGPWTADELATMDSEQGWSGTNVEESSNIVPFAAPHGSDQAVEAEGDGPVDEAEAETEAEAEEPQPGDEPINRGLLLKFLSSVRN